MHNFYVPAGGDIPDPALNPKFDHKLKFLDEMKACEPLHPRGDDRHILVGDLNVAPHENDVWSHKQLLKVVSHTPIECEKLLAAQTHGEWFDVARERIPLSEKVYTWWSYRAADWTVGDRGRRLDHIWVSRALKDGVTDFRITRDARGWERPSDHVPVTVTLERVSFAASDAELGAGHQDVAGELAGAAGEFVAQPARRGGSLSSTRWNRLRATRITVECSTATALDGRRIATISASSPIRAPGPAMISAPPSSTRNAPRWTI